ncbi:unnamed protein product [Parnassius mnemosyne]|uniref:DUF8207 domain-containing protein n=1 Tax=Parnassius mnemosyne TaxID=213953 RepID=A0AAV1L6L0_9NEOP
MKNNDHELNLSVDKMLNPVTEPLKILLNKQKPNQDHNLSTQSCAGSAGSFESQFQNYYDADLSSAESPKNEIKDNLEASLDRNYIYDIYDDKLNIPFGIRKENKTYMMGNSKVTFSKIDSLDNETVFLVKIGDKSYNLTIGLRELLLRKKADLNTLILISSADKLVYKDIIHHTNAHKRDFNPRGQIRASRVAGNTYHDNEILSIIEELKEANIIKE